MRALVLAACLMAGAAAAQEPPGQSCVDVQVGDAHSFGCLNESFQRLAAGAHGTGHAAGASDTLSASSPAPAVGSFSRAATAERMGSNFGHSAFAQRPPPPVYGAPFAPSH